MSAETNPARAAARWIACQAVWCYGQDVPSPVNHPHSTICDRVAAAITSAVEAAGPATVRAYEKALADERGKREAAETQITYEQERNANNVAQADERIAALEADARRLAEAARGVIASGAFDRWGNELHAALCEYDAAYADRDDPQTSEDVPSGTSTESTCGDGKPDNRRHDWEQPPCEHCGHVHGFICAEPLYPPSDPHNPRVGGSPVSCGCSYRQEQPPPRQETVTLCKVCGQTRPICFAMAAHQFIPVEVPR